MDFLQFSFQTLMKDQKLFAGLTAHNNGWNHGKQVWILHIYLRLKPPDFLEQTVATVFRCFQVSFILAQFAKIWFSKFELRQISLNRALITTSTTCNSTGSAFSSSFSSAPVTWIQLYTCQNQSIHSPRGVLQNFEQRNWCNFKMSKYWSNNLTAPLFPPTSIQSYEQHNLTLRHPHQDEG